MSECTFAPRVRKRKNERGGDTAKKGGMKQKEGDQEVQHPEAGRRGSPRGAGHQIESEGGYAQLNKKSENKKNNHGQAQAAMSHGRNNNQFSFGSFNT